jgi:hypothetical protein
MVLASSILFLEKSIAKNRGTSCFFKDSLNKFQNKQSAVSLKKLKTRYAQTVEFS